jgi:hypothetical protein
MNPPDTAPNWPSLALGLLGPFLLSLPVGAQDILADLDRALEWQSPDGHWRLALDGSLDLEAYFGEEPLPGLVFDEDTAFFQPRLTLFAEAALGQQWRVFTQIRADRGFDPGIDTDGEIRADEYALSYRPWENGALQVQAGKFATVFGNWVPRHLSWDNPFITAPVPYESVTVASDVTLVPGPAALLARRELPDNKRSWVPVIWGPSYAAGMSAAGQLGRVDYGVEVKNAALSSRPSQWDPLDVGWDDPTVTARLAWNFQPPWTVGASFSRGAWLQENARFATGAPLAPPLDPGDWPQTTWGLDARYERHHWQIWAEVIGSRFAVPNVGDLESLSYYVEMKYRLGAGWFAAVRWGQQFFDDAETASNPVGWDRDLWRTDFAAGWRITPHAQIKAQYSFGDSEGHSPQGQHLGAVQFTLRF